MQPIPPIPDKPAGLQWLQSLGAQLPSRGVRELAYALTFLTTVADLELTRAEHEALEEFQHALGLEDSRVTDLVVFVTSVVAASEMVAQT